MSNYKFDNQNKKERVLSINENDLDIIFNWFFFYKDNNIYIPEAMKETASILEEAPSFSKKTEFVLLVSHLKNINVWFENYKNPTESDKAVFQIIDNALNLKR